MARVPLGQEETKGGRQEKVRGRQENAQVKIKKDRKRGRGFRKGKSQQAFGRDRKELRED